MVGNKFKKLHHRSYEEPLKTFTKHYSSYWEILGKKASSDQKENIETDQKMIEGEIMVKIYQQIVFESTPHEKNNQIRPYILFYIY